MLALLHYAFSITCPVLTLPVNCIFFITPLSLHAPVALHLLMVRAHPQNDSVLRYPQRNHKDGSKRVRFLWRQRTLRTICKKSAATKMQLAKKRQEKRMARQDAFAAAEAVIMEEARKISAQLGTLSPDQCYQELFQRSRISHTKRSKSRWNAFLHKEIKRRNDGMFKFD